METIDVFGFVGVAIMLFPYILNLRKLLSVDSLWYSGMMCVGGLSASYYSYVSGVLPICILEGIWGLVSLNEFIRDGIKQFKQNKK